MGVVVVGVVVVVVVVVSMGVGFNGIVNLPYVLVLAAVTTAQERYQREVRGSFRIMRGIHLSRRASLSWSSV